MRVHAAFTIERTAHKGRTRGDGIDMVPPTERQKETGIRYEQCTLSYGESPRNADKYTMS